ncbi:hypothetical protein B0J14DRAFT_700282 [Halenospora varia]|nr:hypothetical protein B0J14DRAFT_700282 [Halenospora varia]
MEKRNMAAMSNKFQLMAAVIEQLKEEGALKEIKFSGIAEKLGISRPDTARVRWHRLMKELESGKLWEDPNCTSTTPKKGGKGKADSKGKRKHKEDEDEQQENEDHGINAEDGDEEMDGDVKAPRKKKTKVETTMNHTETEIQEELYEEEYDVVVGDDEIV